MNLKQLYCNHVWLVNTEIIGYATTGPYQDVDGMFRINLPLQKFARYKLSKSCENCNLEMTEYEDIEVEW